jgi:hypothetical protein
VSDNEGDKLVTPRPPGGTEDDPRGSRPPSSVGQAPADLLELVRSAEEAATIATRKHASTRDVPSLSERPPAEDFVDVGEEATDAPPSLPPLRSATPATAFIVPPPMVAAPLVPSRGKPEPDSAAMSPAVSIVLTLALAIGALVAVTR